MLVRALRPRGALSLAMALTTAAFVFAGVTEHCLCAVSLPGARAASFVQARDPGQRRFATTVGALTEYPVFFHLQSVRARGVVQTTGETTALSDQDKSVLLVGPKVAGMPTEAVEAGGVFLDTGRMTEGDPRLSGIDVGGLSESRLGKRWPGVGELLLIVVDEIQSAQPFPAPSIRALALAPQRYLDANVTVSGRFRGRNLYGDQPDAPGRSRWDFVLQVADASIWVVGMRPRGQGFSLDVEARADTGSWLEVAGIVRRQRNLVVLEATAIRLAAPPPSALEPVTSVRSVGPPPTVVFSAPTQDETDVALNTRVRIQFSREIDAASLKGRVRIGYLGAEAVERGEPQAPGIEFTARYDEAARVLEVRFPYPLERFRTLKVELLEGIASGDGALLAPWTLTFSLGG